MKFFGLSDIGLSRPNNEDVWIAMPEIGFFAVADGMGGHNAGEVAARETIDHLCDTISHLQNLPAIDWKHELYQAIEKANQWVYHLGSNTNHLSGMGTTLCCLVCNETHVIFAHVGDSRIYRLRDKKLEQLTEDHSLFTKWLQTGKVSQTPFPYKNVITRAVGTSSKVTPEVASIPSLPGDLFFLCTDGLTDTLTLSEIEKILNASDELESTCKRLIEKAKIKGSSDNITLLMIQIPIHDAIEK